MFPIEALQERIAKSELGQEWIKNPLLNRDVWSVEELGYGEEESKIGSIRNIYFKKFFLSWLKLLTKLTVLSLARERISLNTVTRRVSYLKKFDSFLLEEGYIQPELISSSLIEKFITADSQQERQSTITYVSKLWAEERWLKLPYTPHTIQKHH